MIRLAEVAVSIKSWIARRVWADIQFCVVATFVILVVIGARDVQQRPRWDEKPPWDAASILTVSPWGKVAFFDTSGVRCAVLLDQRGEPVSISCVPSTVTAEKL